MRRATIYLVAVSLLLLALPAATQMGEGNIVKVYFTKAKPGAEKAFEEGLKKHMAWHKAQKDTWAWMAWQTITGEGNGMYGIGSFGHSWEDFDKDVSLQEGHAADVEANLAPNMASLTPTFWAFLKDVSRPAESEAPMSEVITFELQYGKVPEFNYLIKKFTDAIVKTQWAINYEWYALVNGGEVPTYVLVIPRANFAAFKQPEKPFPVMLEEAYGRQEAEALLERLNKCVKEEETELIRSRPDLSYNPAAKGM